MNKPSYQRSVDRPDRDRARVEVPEEVAALFDEEQETPAGLGNNQAFSLITVSPSGHPHVLLLSQTQLALSSSKDELLVSVHGQQTRSNLKEHHQATLAAVTADAAHYLKCTVMRDIEKAGRGGFELRIDEHERDSAGVRLSPLSFEFSPELAVSEHWDLDRDVVLTLRGSSNR